MRTLWPHVESDAVAAPMQMSRTARALAGSRLDIIEEDRP